MASNGSEEVSVTTGAASAQYGNAQAGIVNISTRTGSSKFAARLAAETDAVFGSTLGMGFNRFEANVSGPMGVKGLTFNFAGAAEGNLSVRSGKGRQDFPVFVSTGVDTVVNNPDSTVAGGYTQSTSTSTPFTPAVAPRLRATPTQGSPATMASRVMGRGCRAPAFRRTN